MGFEPRAPMELAQLLLSDCLCAKSDTIVSVFAGTGIGMSSVRSMDKLF